MSPSHPVRYSPHSTAEEGTPGLSGRGVSGAPAASAAAADLSEVWRAFCARLAGAPGPMEAEHLQLDELDLAEGLRFLGRLTRSALNALDRSDTPDRPRFTPFGPPDTTYGIPNPDNLYQRCSVDPSLEYRIVGRRNTVCFFAIGAQAVGRAARPGTPSHLDHSRLQMDEDGSFEIHVGGAPRDGNWIELSPDVTFLMVRQTFLRRDEETAAELRIECLSDPAAPRATSWSSVERRLTDAAEQVHTLTAFWPAWVGSFADHAPCNGFFRFDLETHLAIGGDPQIITPLCRWRVAEGEALEIVLRPPTCEYWNIQLATIWSEPVEAHAGLSCRNAAEVTFEPDGSVVLVVSPIDPGHPNWLDTGGHRQGLITVRWVNAEDHPIPTTRIIEL